MEDHVIWLVKVTESGQITIPAELRRKHNMKTGDQVMWTEDEQGRIVVKPKRRSASGLDGISSLRPGVVADDDFGNIIAEAMEENAARIVADMNDECGKAVQ